MRQGSRQLPFGDLFFTDLAITAWPATDTNEGIVTLLYENGRAQRLTREISIHSLQFPSCGLCALPFSYKGG